MLEITLHAGMKNAVQISAAFLADEILPSEN